MESTGIAEHIQISESSFFLLTGSFPGFFRCKQRGQVEIKVSEMWLNPEATGRYRGYRMYLAVHG
jgi:hypothetical protein